MNKVFIIGKGSNLSSFLSKKIINSKLISSREILTNYDLLLRLKREGVSCDNMDEILIDYRIHTEASRRRLLGYAEASSYALREFILNKTFINFIAVCWHIFKSFVRSDKSKIDE